MSVPMFRYHTYRYEVVSSFGKFETDNKREAYIKASDWSMASDTVVSVTDVETGNVSCFWRRTYIGYLREKRN